MIKILLVLLLIFIGWVIYFIIQPKIPSIRTGTKEVIIPPSPTSSTSQSYEIAYNNQKIAVGIIPIKNLQSLTLIPNFKEKLSTSQIMRRNDCKAGVNGGFYDENNNPLGLIVASGNVYNRSVESRLFNGYFHIDSNNLGKISYEEPQTNSIWAIQSGPMLIFDEKKLPLNINNDEIARRMVVAEAINQEIIFLTFYDKESLFEGPLLSELPGIIKESESSLGIKIKVAMNLDGGSASAFWSDNLRLEELAPVGSFFCVK